MDDEAKEENDYKSNENTFPKRTLFNKRICKYIALYSLVYMSSRKLFDPWYKTPKYTSNVLLSSIDRNRHMIEGVIGSDSHKPSSNMSLMAFQIIQNLLFLFKAKPSWKHYAFATTKQLEDSLHPSYKNTDLFYHGRDIYIAIWSFLIVIDAYDCIKKRKFNTNDRAMFFHHILMLGNLLLGCSYENGGVFWCNLMVLGESVAILATIASFIRVIYQKKRRDLPILRNISDLLFAIHAVWFTYVRIWVLPFFRVPLGFKFITLDKYKQFSLPTRIYCTVAMSLNLFGIFWVYSMWKVVITNFKKSIKK